MQKRKYPACALPYDPRLSVLYEKEAPKPFLVVVAVALTKLSKGRQISSTPPMSVLFLALQYGTILYVVKRLVYYISVKRKFAKAAKGGCEPAHVFPRKDPLGIINAMAHGRARDQCRWPNYLLEVLDTVGKNTHTVWERPVGNNFLFTRDPENFKAVLATQAEAFILGEGRSQNFMDLFGPGVFTSEGNAWQHSRALVRPQFARQQISDVNRLEDHVQQLWRRLSIGNDRWTEVVDLQPLFLNLTIDMITELVFGYSVNSQDPLLRSPLPGVNPPDPAKFASNIDTAASWIARRTAFGKWYWLFQSRDFSRSCKEVHGYVDWFVQLELSRKAKSQADQSAGPNFVLLAELSKITQDPLVLRNETLNLIPAGRNTTASLLGWLFYFLSRKPSTYDKLRGAVLNDIGTSGVPDCTKLLSCQYLQYCLKESLRLCPGAPAIIRKATQNVIIPRGGGKDGNSPVLVPQNSFVVLCIHALHHREDIWGEDVEDFKPERWQEHQFAWDYLPFSAGPRKCLGRELLRQ